MSDKLYRKPWEQRKMNSFCEFDYAMRNKGIRNKVIEEKEDYYKRACGRGTVWRRLRHNKIKL